MKRLLCTLLLGASLVVIGASPGSAGGGGHCEGKQTTGEGDTVEMAGACFEATVLRVEPGTDVEFLNRDPFAHVVTGVGWGDGEYIESGQSVQHTFDEAGAFPYTCNLHRGMSGVVLVGYSEPQDGFPADPIAARRESASDTTLPTVLLIAFAVGAVALYLGRKTAHLPRSTD